MHNSLKTKKQQQNTNYFVFIEHNERFYIHCSVCECMKATRKATSNVLTRAHAHPSVFTGQFRATESFTKTTIKRTTIQVHKSKAAKCLKNKLTLNKPGQKSSLNVFFFQVSTRVQ